MACGGASALDDGVYRVHGFNNAERSGDTFDVVSLRNAQWSFRALEDGSTSIQAYDANGTWVWGREGFVPDADGVFSFTLDQAASCDDLPSYHEFVIAPRGSDRFEGFWDLWQQPAHCDESGCVCTGAEIVRTWALDLDGTWERVIPDGF